jgi:DNA-directed RNA polymerase specialized sigma24 family protein
MSESDRRREENLRIGRLDLRDALDSLSADDRALFIFKDEMGYSAAAIAAFFGQNDRWVENKIVSIRKRLKEFSIGPISGV